MTDNKIIKALEHCGIECKCNGCPLDDSEFVSNCIDELCKNALDLINRQEAEIERLKQENKEYCEDNRIIAYQRNQRDKEIRALHNQLNGLNFMDKQIKSEAIKEFAEKFVKTLSEFDMSSVGLPDYDRGYKDCMTAIEDTIDNLVK